MQWYLWLFPLLSGQKWVIHIWIPPLFVKCVQEHGTSSHDGTYLWLWSNYSCRDKSKHSDFIQGDSSSRWYTVMWFVMVNDLKQRTCHRRRLVMEASVSVRGVDKAGTNWTLFIDWLYTKINTVCFKENSLVWNGVDSWTNTSENSGPSDGVTTQFLLVSPYILLLYELLFENKCDF